MGFRKQDSTRRDPQGRDGCILLEMPPFFNEKMANFREIVFHSVLQTAMDFHVKHRALFNIYHFYKPSSYVSLSSSIGRALGFGAIGRRFASPSGRKSFFSFKTRLRDLHRELLRFFENRFRRHRFSGGQILN